VARLRGRYGGTSTTIHNENGLNQLCFGHCSPCFLTVPHCTAVCLHPAAAPTTGHLAGAGESRSHGTPYIKYEYGDDRRGVSPSSSFREGASSEGKGPANNLLPRNRRPESWAPWEDVKLGNYRPIQVGRGGCRSAMRVTGAVCQQRDCMRTHACSLGSVPQGY
jgi:hypothetical protein